MSSHKVPHIPQSELSRGRMYEICIRSVCYIKSIETWTMKEKIKNILKRCNQRMLRYMAGVRLYDYLPCGDRYKVWFEVDAEESMNDNCNGLNMRKNRQRVECYITGNIRLLKKFYSNDATLKSSVR